MRRGKYTIGYVTGRTVMPSSGWSIQYRFAVRDTTYTGSAPEHGGMNRKDGARYLLTYDSLAPDWSQIDYEAPIPDSIGQAPPNGWRWRPWPDSAHPELSRPAHTPTEAELWPQTKAVLPDSTAARTGW